MPIEDWIQGPIASERHERTVAASPERAVELALEVPAEGDPVVAALVRLRGLRFDGDSELTLEQAFRRNGFIELAREPREVIVGVGAPAKLWSDERISDPAAWRSFRQPGWIKAAATFRAEPAGESRARLITETWVSATDESARRRFRAYWLLIRPFSGLIRRRWLRQIALAAQAERRSSPGT